MGSCLGHGAIMGLAAWLSNLFSCRSGDRVRQLVRAWGTVKKCQLGIDN